MQAFRNIDWNRAWSADRKPGNRANNVEFRNRRAPSFAEHVQQDDKDDYVDPFLHLVDPQPEWSVLDVGSGPGTLACPLAAKVRQVTAIDFSPVMIGILKERKEKLGLRNLTEQVASWDDDWRARGVGPHDVVIASRSMACDDPRAALEKLISFARRRVYISFIVGEGPRDRRILEAVGREREANPSPDYIYIYNLLYQMGIFANVFMIEKELRTFSGQEDAFDTVRWMVDNITPNEEETLRSFICAHLVPHGDRWRLDYQRPVRWAVMWWNIDQNG